MKNGKRMLSVRSFYTANKRNVMIAAIVIVAIGVTGSFLLLTKAAGSIAATETESGTKSAQAKQVADTTASGGQAVKFTAPAAQGTITHGSQINTSNTGYLAYVGPAGQTCTDATLVVYNTKPNASSLGANPFCLWLKQGLNVDVPITITASRIDQEVYTNGKRVVLNWVTVNTATPQDYAIGPDNFSVYRTQLTGSSDGIRFEQADVVESYVRTKLQSPTDHNDGIQGYLASSGGSILRSNIDCRPVNGTNATTTGAIFMADDSQGTVEIRDNYLLGGGYTLRLHESMFYRVTGNIIEKNSYEYGPISTTNARSGAFLEWSNNKLSDGTVLTP